MAYRLINDSLTIDPVEPVRKRGPARNRAVWLMLLVVSVAIVCVWPASMSRVVELGSDPRLFHAQVAAR